MKLELVDVEIELWPGDMMTYHCDSSTRRTTITMPELTLDVEGVIPAGELDDALRAYNEVESELEDAERDLDILDVAVTVRNERIARLLTENAFLEADNARLEGELSTATGERNYWMELWQQTANNVLLLIGERDDAKDEALRAQAKLGEYLGKVWAGYLPAEGVREIHERLTDYMTRSG